MTQKLPFQERVGYWIRNCFGKAAEKDKSSRGHRFVEEALELAQATGCSKEDVYKLVEYVYGRRAGEAKQEVGGVMITLAGLCTANEIDLEKCAEDELARVWTKVEQIRQKEASKTVGSALPGSYKKTKYACYIRKIDGTPSEYDGYFTHCRQVVTADSIQEMEKRISWWRNTYLDYEYSIVPYEGE